MKYFDLSGKVAVVTGGNRGIGFGITKGLADAGATAIITNRDAAAGQKAAASLEQEGLKVAAVSADVTSAPSIQKMVSRVISDYGQIDILVNNAAVVLRKPAEDVLEEEWDNLMNLNVRGTFFCCQIVGREMMRSNGGKIINISSNVSNRLQPIRSVYATSKAAINHLTRALAMEWAKYNINVNVLAPSVTITDINRKYYLEEHPEALEAHLKLTPKGRVATSEDYVGAAIFLASDEADYVTGQILYVDGGVTL
jgi:NAD(P)-dependent dehydrogenase (short-subunit alcohol dehydrogenase family)